MKNLLKIFSLYLTVAFVVCCSPTLNYLGKSYSPTQNVDIFFDEPDINKEYEVMGMVKNEGLEIDLDDPESVQNAMIKKAKSVGADAILFMGFYQEKETSRTSNTTFDKNSVNETSTTNTQKIYEAKFLKYKN